MRVQLSTVWRLATAWGTGQKERTTRVDSSHVVIVWLAPDTWAALIPAGDGASLADYPVSAAWLADE